MGRMVRFIPALAVVLVLAACGDQATDTPFSPAGPVLSGHTAGGNLNDSTAVGSTTSGTTTPTDTTFSGHTAGGN